MGKVEQKVIQKQKIQSVGKKSLVKSKLGQYKNLSKKMNNIKKQVLQQQKQEIQKEVEQKLQQLQQQQQLQQETKQIEKKVQNSGKNQNLKNPQNQKEKKVEISKVIKKQKKVKQQKQKVQQQNDKEEVEDLEEEVDDENIDKNLEIQEEQNQQQQKLSKQEKEELKIENKKLSRKQKQKAKKLELQEKRQKKQEKLEKRLIKNHIRTDIEFFRLQQIKKLNQKFLDLCKGQKIVPPLLGVERWRWRNKFLENTKQEEVILEENLEEHEKIELEQKKQQEQEQKEKEQKEQENKDTKTKEKFQRKKKEKKEKKVCQLRDPFFPVNGQNDQELINALKKLKVPLKKAKQIVYSLGKASRQIVEQIQAKLKTSNKSKIFINQQEDKDGNNDNYQVFYSPDGKSQNQKQICVITKMAYNKIYLMYGQHNKDMNDFQENLFCLLTRYKCLQGPGSQAAIPEKVFEVLSKEFQANFECFASPLNCYFRDNYCSAFNDVDKCFGSKGNFFDYDVEEGSFQANPPFIPELMGGMQKHMEKLLEKSKKPLSFCLIVPAWENQKFWQNLTESKYQCGMFIINKDQHKYKEGLQHEKKTGLIRQSPHDTGIVFLQNEEGKKKWGYNKSKEIKIREAMNVSI